VRNFATRENVHLAKKVKYYLVTAKKKKLKLSEELLVFHVIKSVGRHKAVEIISVIKYVI
jgi:hypothetical protein